MRKFIDIWTGFLAAIQPFIVLGFYMFLGLGVDREPFATARSLEGPTYCTLAFYCGTYLGWLGFFPLINAPVLLVLRFMKRWLFFTTIGYAVSTGVILYLALFFDEIYAYSFLLHLVPLSVLLIYVFSGEASKE